MGHSETCAETLATRPKAARRRCERSIAYAASAHNRDEFGLRGVGADCGPAAREGRGGSAALEGRARPKARASVQAAPDPEPTPTGPSDKGLVIAARVGTVADTASTALKAVQVLSDNSDIAASSAATLSAMLQSSALSPSTLAVIADISGVAASAITT